MKETTSPSSASSSERGLLTSKVAHEEDSVLGSGLSLNCRSPRTHSPFPLAVLDTGEPPAAQLAQPPSLPGSPTLAVDNTD